MTGIDAALLRKIAELEATPHGAYNIRKNGQLDSRNSTASIEIITKTDKAGIDIHIRPAPERVCPHSRHHHRSGSERSGIQRLFCRGGLRR